MHRLSGGFFFGLMLAALLTAATPAHAADAEGFETIFDGKTLNGWDGNPEFWRVEDGAIVGQTTPEKPTKGNTFLIWRGGDVDNFELKFEYKIDGGNSGVQYRSFEVPNEKWAVGGYQADFEAGDTYSGILYGERFRGILAQRGQKTVIGDDHKPKVVGSVGNSAEINAKIKKNDWNDYTVTANDFQFVHKINGVTTCEVVDEDKAQRRPSGILAFQLHAGPPMKVQFRNVRLNKLPKSTPAASAAPGKKKVVFVAGRPSHGYGSHEHNAGCLLLSRELKKAMPNYDIAVHLNGWPKDANAFDGADAIVMYCDGGGGHMAIPHLDQVDALAKNGVGVACIHYAVEVPAGKPGEKFLDWIGGYFEMNWSVNPHWQANFAALPNHPITRGVQPFKINDEWYYHMRFRPDMQGVTPILTDLPPQSTLSRGDGSHSGNPHVRKAVAEGQKQHVAWAAERPDGGRGFGFTGGHFHENWGDDNFRKVMLNAIVWVSKDEVPAQGVGVHPVTSEDLEANQDEPKPGQPKPKPAPAKQSFVPAGKALFGSQVVTKATPGHAVDIDVDITGAKELYLVVTDAGDGFSADWADWAEPRLEGPKGQITKLTDLQWKATSSGWGGVRINQNAGGQPLQIGGKSVEYGIGTHANSIIAYNLPSGFTRFKARAGLDHGGSSQPLNPSVTFMVFTAQPTPQAMPSTPGRLPENAVAGLDVAPGLEAQVFAAEPLMLNPTNIDVDHLGRVWVCEVQNYRHRQGTRPDGDQILILEDSDGDGVADKKTVFYQGKDIDSALGICVLGNKVIVSCAPNVFLFTDENNDGKADKKELLFTKVGQPQHDHSTHAFVFGPDGKLYWNVGNTGGQVHDKDGKIIVDKAGNEVRISGKPYRQGLVFRCDPDGSNFEVLGHNFRNNYEVSVDSFGTLWQSDNDDDGNRGVRINYVMEFGNYGYVDELSGAGWNSPRTNLESDTPLRHWHLNDPGVVPNFVQTGGGSPTGILVYEGELLTAPFRNQVIHCDAGPNIVRAYPAKDSGAGYSGEMLNLVHGARDNWFRPSDACVAPDGSVIIADWYDPGVGGHRMGDVDRGRLFRVAPPGAKYTMPKYDFATAAGAVEALKSPNLEARYLAWTALHKMGAQAEPALLGLYKSNNPRYRARALWLLGKIEGQGPKYVEQATSDADPNIRITGLRLARQLGGDVLPVVKKLAKDPSPQVRRECAIALRHNTSPDAAALWAELAAQHDGKDRWYLEALGIAADRQWDAFLAAWLAKAGTNWNTPAGRDLVWRSRAAETPKLLVQIINDPSTTAADLPRYFRAFDFLVGPSKDEALVSLALATPSGDPAKQTFIAAEAIKRLGNIDLSKNPQHAAALENVLKRMAGSSEYIKLVDRFSVASQYPELLAIAQKAPDQQLGVEAIVVLLAKKEQKRLFDALAATDATAALSTALALSNSADGRAAAILEPTMQDAAKPLELRRQAARGLTKTRNGLMRLLELAQQQKLDAQVAAVLAVAANTSPWNDLNQQAAKLFPLPAGKDDQPLPPLAELLKMPGDAVRGEKLFATTGTCANCHVVNGAGKEVGPNLSEIGAKLSREAFFESILYPSAGISHNYETHVVILDSGNIVTGIITSQTDDEIAIKGADALVRTFKTDEIDAMKKQDISLMPADLQKVLSPQDLADIVQYLQTLKKAK